MKPGVLQCLRVQTARVIFGVSDLMPLGSSRTDEALMTDSGTVAADDPPTWAILT